MRSRGMTSGKAVSRAETTGKGEMMSKLNFSGESKVGGGIT